MLVRMSTADQVAAIHASPLQASLVVTGGGTSALSALLTQPGASATVLEAGIPYAATALREFLGVAADQACSEQTARAMAMVAFQRARRLAPDAGSLAGIAATAALATNRRRRGTDRIHIAIQTADYTSVVSELLTSDTRAGQEARCCTLLLDAIADAAGTGRQITARTEALPSWRELICGQRAHTGKTVPRVVFPGSFNPLHDGHRQMAKIASDLLGSAVTLEISAFNVDKPPLDYVEFAVRDSQPREGLDLLFTNAPTFLAKAEIFPGAGFVVGADTITRIGAPRYYGGTVGRDAALRSLAALGTRFLVFGRALQSGFETLSSLEIPDALRVLCTEVPESTFRLDVSSTALRRQADSNKDNQEDGA